MSRDGRRIQHGWYCADCGALYAKLGYGAITCQRCGALGLRGFRKRPRTVVCPHQPCSWMGWDDGGVNDDLGRHVASAHAAPRKEPQG